ncbi:hypothetical protein SEA_FLAPPER_2 [Gordonia phage Flapper]|uniref:Uncharacterized protein n=1 Tax=Gordonia phage Flapper TaxID=2079415 RepID=A0A2L1IX35_9CAUD|nr:hypothetical protein KNT82_gp02 [Gordonia phage Flapper]AVD99747.1 hypothetical protein SEA_FLAPPER_2 [Gordonia phage Flapper]
MIEPVRHYSTDRRRPHPSARVACDTPSCPRKTYLHPETEAQAKELDPGSAPGPWVTQRLLARKWSVAHEIGTYCPEHTVVVPDTDERISVGRSEAARARHAEHRRNIQEQIAKADRKRELARQRSNRYNAKKRGNK